MNIGFSGEAFRNLFLLSGFAGLVVSGVVTIVAYWRGVSIFKDRFLLTLLLIWWTIFILIPFWLADFPIKWKLILSIASYAYAVGHYFAMGRMQRILSEKFGKKKDSGTGSKPGGLS